MRNDEGPVRPRSSAAYGRLRNLRDLGGYRTGDGREVRWGRLYRSDSLAKLGPAEWAQLRADLGLRTVLDLRYPFEIAAKGRVPPTAGVAYWNLSIQHRPYDQTVLPPEVAPGPYFADRYAELALDGTVELRRALEIIAHSGSTPLAMHCSSGKDRTGVLSALVLALLGVSGDDIAADFALTGHATAGLVADWRAANPGRSLWPGYGHAPREAMYLFLARLTAEYGSVAGYVATQLGVDEALLGALRARLLDR